jgi:aromatic ring-cleaving dioxygenase
MAETATADGRNPTYESIDESIPEEFHFHLYFDEATRDDALAIRERLVKEATFRYQMPPVRERPMGPHPQPIWSIWVDRPAFGEATFWMSQNHGDHPVLVHPNIDDGYEDHTSRAMWLGEPQTLKLHVFKGHTA